CPDWSFLARTGERAAIVVPIPLSPLGRALTDDEEHALLEWLRGSKHRLLIVDAVYTFDFVRCSAFTTRLIREAQGVVLWSCSKSWLKPSHLGIAVAPPELALALRHRVSPPPTTTLGRVTALLDGQPDLPRLQQEAFLREWRRLDDRIRTALP